MTDVHISPFDNDLFEAVQLGRVFPDGKTFVDCRPKTDLKTILALYAQQKGQPGFALDAFVRAHFELPVPHSVYYTSDTSKSVTWNIEALWPVLTRQPDTENGTLIPLPFPYIVPGGRFGEIYYWDSYFTMLGLKASGRFDMIENMIGNFAYLIDTLGYIPNGNRHYFLGRSQPPYFAQMILLLAAQKGVSVYLQYLPQLEKEYRYWMKGAEELSEDQPALFHCVLMKNGEIMNRYKDERNTPRPESYREDVELAQSFQQDPSILYAHLRAGAESGWDFSSRWFNDNGDFSGMHCTDIIPVDLNCLLLGLEQVLAQAYELKGDAAKAVRLVLAADKRKKAIDHYCWNETTGFYMDYDWRLQKQKTALTLAGMSPLYFNLADKAKAEKVQQHIQQHFLKEGGVVTTLKETGQQWDAPNGWAPLQWISIRALENYGYTSLAREIARRWIRLNSSVFKRTGKLMEKYNVTDMNLEAGGGEYEGQDGFGWTNGVLLDLISRYGDAG
ncbi:MAG: alpha,alpha-trehalase TreF [Chitinophagales bacterium]|nr:alpha,alpha-trehalase TreF [Chitinophagales bacterium]